MKKFLVWLLLLCMAMPGALAENVSFSGTVVSSETVEVYAEASALAEQVNVKAGQYVAEDDLLAVLSTTKVYAPISGVVSALFAEVGDDAADVTASWGSVMLLDETVAFTVSADIEKAYDSLETQLIVPGETVYLQSRSEESRTGAGIVTTIDNTAYTVKGTEGSFVPGETVDVFRTADWADESCLGRGTVARTAPTAITADGTIVFVSAEPGTSIQKGDVLMGTLSGVTDSPLLSAPISGTVAQVNLTQGSSVAQGDVAFVIYPEGSMKIECAVPEGDLGYLSVGDAVTITFLWNENQPYAGTVESISAAAEEGTTDYTAVISFTPDENVRYGMTVTVEPKE